MKVSGDSHAVADLPVSSALRLIKLYASEQLCTLVPDEEDTENLAEERLITLSWDWRVAQAREFQVAFTVLVHPSKKIRERVRVSYVTHFALGTEPLGMAIHRFAKLNAIALMLPHVRETVLSLTARSFFAPTLLPLMDPVRIADELPDDETTAAEQFRERPGLAEFFGHIAESALPPKPSYRRQEAAHPLRQSAALGRSSTEGRFMGKSNEKTSSKVAKVAGKVLSTGKATPKQAKTLAASALTQTSNKSKSGKKK